MKSCLFSSNSAIKLRQNKGIFSTLLFTTYNYSPTLKYCFSSTFFLSHFFLLSRKGCNYCAQMQGCQETLTNPQLRGLKNTLCILLRLKSRSVRGASHHPVFIGSQPTISHMVFSRAYPADEFSFT